MPANPKIAPVKDNIDRMLEIASTVFLLMLWVLVIFSYYKLPETIPIHFNAKGEADGYGAKSSLFILPVLATAIYLGMGFLNKYPYRFNYTIVINEENAGEQYKLATRLLRYVKLSVLIIFFAIVLFTHLTVSGVTNGMSSWFLPFAVGLIMIPTLITLHRSFKKKT